MAFDATAAVAGGDLLGGIIGGGTTADVLAGGVADMGAADAALGGVGGGTSLGSLAGYGMLASGAGSLLNAGASLSGANKIAGSSNNAINAELQMFNTQNQQQAPYRAAGTTALGDLTRGLGPQAPGDPNGPLSADQVQALYQHYLGRQASPDEVNWQLSQGQNAAQMEAGMSSTPEYQQRVQSGQAPVQGLYNNAGSSVSPGQFARAPNQQEIGQFLNPAMNFAIGQGVGAVTNLNNASGGSLSGNTLKAITDYATNTSLNNYWNPAVNLAFQNQGNVFNRLASVAGLGQTANQTSATLAGTVAPSVANIGVGSGQAQAAGTVGVANALSSGANNALGWYALPAIMNQG